MKVKVKQYSGGKFDVEIEPTMTIKQVKDKIASEQSGFENGMRLIFAGEVLDDGRLVSDTGIQENTFLVALAAKARRNQTTTTTASAGAAVSASTSVSSTATTNDSTSSTSTVVSTGTSSTSASTTSDPVSEGTTSAASTSQAETTSATETTGEEQEVLQNLVSMGYPEDQARAALRAAFNDPNRAVQYLLEGIPDHLIQAVPTQPTSGPSDGAETSANMMEMLARIPGINALRAQVQNDPSSLPRALQTIGGQNPELLHWISNHQQEFLEFMNETVDEEEMTEQPETESGSPAMGQMPGLPAGMTPQMLGSMIGSLPEAQRNALAQQMGMAPEALAAFGQMMSQGGPQGGSQGGGAGGPPVISLTREEMDAVNRLSAMGFSQQAAAQAYIACDKNEELAANYLLEHAYDDEDDQMTGGN